MKNVFIIFKNQYDIEDYKNDNLTYSYKNNMLIIENVKEIIFENNMICISSTKTSKSRKIDVRAYDINNIDNVTIN